MSQKINLTKHIIAAGLIIISAMFFVSCEKYEWVKPVLDPTIPISFQNEIVPIFSTVYGPENKSCIGCHGNSPNFNSTELYNTLNSGLINKDNPESSLIIQKLYGSHNARCSEENKQRILIWIQQGANPDTK